jgi:hypothetical protein
MTGVSVHGINRPLLEKQKNFSMRVVMKGVVSLSSVEAGPREKIMRVGKKVPI